MNIYCAQEFLTWCFSAYANLPCSRLSPSVQGVIKTEAKNSSSTSALSISHASSKTTFSIVDLFCRHTYRDLLALDIPSQIQVHVSFGFSNSVYIFLDGVTIFLLCYLYPFYTFCIFPLYVLVLLKTLCSIMCTCPLPFPLLPTPKCIFPKITGGDPWTSSCFPGPIFHPSPYPTGLFQAVSQGRSSSSFLKSRAAILLWLHVSFKS